jgi:hypothetical protein
MVIKQLNYVLLVIALLQNYTHETPDNGFV